LTVSRTVIRQVQQRPLVRSLQVAHSVCPHGTLQVSTSLSKQMGQALPESVCTPIGITLWRAMARIAAWTASSSV
jgi:hypothetical protein